MHVARCHRHWRHHANLPTSVRDAAHVNPSFCSRRRGPNLPLSTLHRCSCNAKGRSTTKKSAKTTKRRRTLAITLCLGLCPHECLTPPYQSVARSAFSRWNTCSVLISHEAPIGSCTTSRQHNKAATPRSRREKTSTGQGHAQQLHTTASTYSSKSHAWLARTRVVVS